MHLFKRSLIGPEAYGDYINGSHRPDMPEPFLGWNFPNNMQHLVHDHWRNFPAPRIYSRSLFIIAYLIMIILSLFGNGLVVWIFSTSKNLRTPSNLLIINLAIFDLIMFTNMPHFLANALTGNFVGGELGCNLYAMNGGISGLGGAITNAFIAYDRYRTISNPIDGRLNYTQICILITISWLWTVPYSVMPFFQIWGRYIPEGYLLSSSFDYLTDNDEVRYFIQSMFVWAYCIPMVIICTNYARLFLHVRGHERMLAEQAKKMNVKSLASNANASTMTVEMRIAKAALTIYMLYVISWTPYATVALLGTFGYKELITPFVSMLPSTFAKIVSCLDPWVYAASHPKYRAELERRLPWLGVREKSYSANGGGNVGGGNSDRGGTNEGETVSMDTIN